MFKKIHESEYGDSPLNFHVDKRGDELHVDLTYPPWTDADNKNGQCRYVCVDQEAVRASDGVRLHYDYQRDGFVVEQPRPHMKVTGPNSYDSVTEWIEVGFFESWKFDVSVDDQMKEADELAAQRS
jgi:hypothetical protein